MFDRPKPRAQLELEFAERIRLARALDSWRSKMYFRYRLPVMRHGENTMGWINEIHSTTTAKERHDRIVSDCFRVPDSLDDYLADCPGEDEAFDAVDDAWVWEGVEDGL